MQKEAHPINVRQAGPRPLVGEFEHPTGAFSGLAPRPAVAKRSPASCFSLFSGHGRPPSNFPRDGLHGWPALWVRKKPGRGLAPRPPTRLGQEGGALGAHILGFPGFSLEEAPSAGYGEHIFGSFSVVSMDLLYLRAQNGRHSYSRRSQ